MTDESFREAKRAIYTLAHHVAPDESKQNRLLRAIQEAESHGESNLTTIKIMLYPIMDGLMYSNWP